MNSVHDVLKKYFPAVAPPAEPNPCPVCGDDRAYAVAEAESGMRIWIPAEDCLKCEEKAKKDRELENIRAGITSWMQRAGVPMRYLHAEMHLMQGLTVMQMEAVMHVQSGESVVLHGGVGSGKTMLACAMMRDMIHSGRVHPSGCRFVVVPDMLGEMKEAMELHDKSPEAVVNDLITCGFLILDDVGAEHDTSWAKEVLYRIINNRYNDMRQTIFTSNFKPDTEGSIAKILGQRIVSRLASYRCVQTGFRDWRRG
jgi:DNA replication protein DnaC/primosomal protein DnaI